MHGAALKDFNTAGPLDPSHPSINAGYVIYMKTPKKYAVAPRPLERQTDSPTGGRELGGSNRIAGNPSPGVLPTSPFPSLGAD